MRAVVQRVSRASVTVDGEVTGKIANGLLVLLGVGRDDSETDAEYLAEKIVAMRVFPDAAGKMNLSLADCGGGLLVVPQFTLLGDCGKGRRPNFGQAAPRSRRGDCMSALSRHRGRRGRMSKREYFRPTWMSNYAMTDR